MTGSDILSLGVKASLTDPGKVMDTLVLVCRSLSVTVVHHCRWESHFHTIRLMISTWKTVQCPLLKPKMQALSPRPVMVMATKDRVD